MKCLYKLGDETVIHLTSDKFDLSGISDVSQSIKKNVASASGEPQDIAHVREEKFSEVAGDSKAELANWEWVYLVSTYHGSCYYTMLLFYSQMCILNDAYE